MQEYLAYVVPRLGWRSPWLRCLAFALCLGSCLGAFFIALSYGATTAPGTSRPAPKASALPAKLSKAMTKATRPNPPETRKAAVPVSPKKRAVLRVQSQLKLFLAARLRQTNPPNAMPFPTLEAQRWTRLLTAIESNMSYLPSSLAQRLRTTLEHESDQDRNRFLQLPATLSERIIKCMIALSVHVGIFRRPAPVAAPAPRKKVAKKPRHIPNPSELPPLVFTQRDIERFNPPDQLSWPIKGGRIGSGFGWRKDPFTRRRSFHGAVDIGASYGASVYAASGGVVVRTGWMGSCGMGVVLQHSPILRTYYCHLSQILAPSGKVVARGQRIGRVGSSGRSTSPHLHFVVSLNGRSVNPANYLKQ